MALALAAAGHEVGAYDLQPERRAAVTGTPVAVHTSIGAVADGVDAVILSLPSDSADLAVCAELQTAGVLVLDTSTVDPSTSRTCADLIGGDRFCDCPILGRPDKVGRWTIPAGGREATVAVAATLLAPVAARVVRVGDVGAAATLKVVNNMMLSVINAVTAEALVLARASGLDPTTFVDIISDSGAATVSGLFRDVAPRAVRGDYTPAFTLDLLAKDAGLALDLAAAHGVPLDLVEASQRLNRAGLAAGASGLDTIAVVKALEQRTGLRVAEHHH
jgi:3-hydroxyisobutyrate dehydrogenase-like beta-hydroxyacid dehydrogenase